MLLINAEGSTESLTIENIFSDLNDSNNFASCSILQALYDYLEGRRIINKITGGKNYVLPLSKKIKIQNYFSARVWLHSRAIVPGSFYWCCFSLSLNPENILSIVEKNKNSLLPALHYWNKHGYAKP